jgi:hypothetical protein
VIKLMFGRGVNRSNFSESREQRTGARENPETSSSGILTTFK